MNQEYTPLVLDDVVHILSPSPAPQQPAADDPEMAPRIRSPTPEPIQEADIMQMRKRVMDMRISYKGDGPEKELADMILRLTRSPLPDTEQIVRQADMISALTLQRDMLMHQAEEQRLRWASEKDGWERMVEALIAQQAKNRTDRDDVQEIERLNNTLDTENKGLRQRLNETQIRMQILEAELTRLRPLLLMQPLSSGPSVTTPRSKLRRRRKDTDQQHPVTDDEPMDATDDNAGVRGSSEVLDTPTRSLPSQSTPKSKSRNSVYFQPPHKRRSSLKSNTRGLSADARVEHLLLAARKVGKERASLMSGMMQQTEERDRERRREDTVSTAVATTPKTPKRVAAYPGYMHPENGYVYLTSPMQSGSGIQPIPIFIPAFPPPAFQTPSSSTMVASAASSSQQPTMADARSQNPHTPLDSLLSAARSMMDGDEDANDAESKGSRRSVEDDVPDSPLPKRRKLTLRDNTMGTQDTTGPSTPTAKDSLSVGSKSAVGRVRSALDVLADQAAVFSSQDVSSRPALIQTKGKGKERADALEPTSGAVSKPKGRRTQRRSIDPSASPFFERTSRSQASVPNTGNNFLSSTKDLLTSEVPGDPGGRNGETSSSLQGNDASSLASTSAVPHSSESPAADSGEDLDKTPTQTTSAASKLRRTASPRSQSKSAAATSTLAESQPAMTPPLQQRASTASPSNRAGSPLDTQIHQHPETTPMAAPPGDPDPSISGPDPGTSTGASGFTLRNKNVTRVAEQDVPAPRRQRSPYVKWSKEEDELLAQAVAKYGQKWDQVSKALPSRGYHQVRQRWLRKLGAFDNKPDLTTFQATALPSPMSTGGTPSEPLPNPKLGLAPLSSELAFSSLNILTGRGSSGPPSSMPS